MVTKMSLDAALSRTGDAKRENLKKTKDIIEEE
jgi:hypothetical protein